MHYVKHFNINGVDTRQVSCIELRGKPNAATEGSVGVLGIDITSPTNDVYKCVAVNGSIYTWELLSSGMSILSATISGQGVESVQFAYENLRTPAMYVVKVGDLILDTGGFLYEISSLGSTYCVATYHGVNLTATTHKHPTNDVLGLTTENFTFTFEDGSTETKAVYVDGDGNENTNGLICDINSGISVVDAGLTYSRGVVAVRKIGSVLWVTDSGVYNFTDSFATTNNRTVLQFTLPKALSNMIPNVNGVYGTSGTIGYSPALAYENVTYTTFNCQAYLKRSEIGEEVDTFQVVYTGLSAINGGGLCGFHLKLPLLLVCEGE